MRRVLITGMSGTGKSTALAALDGRGYRTVELDDAWCVPQPDGTRLWDERKVAALLSEEGDATLVVAGCEANMGTFLRRFDRVILLSAPQDVLVERLRARTGDDFGASPAEVDRVLRDLAEVEPLLRDVADVEIDTSGSWDETWPRIAEAVGPGT